MRPEDLLPEELKRWQDRVTYKDYIRHKRVQFLERVVIILALIFCMLSSCLIGTMI